MWKCRCWINSPHFAPRWQSDHPPLPSSSTHMRLFNDGAIFQPSSMARVLLVIIPRSCFSGDNLGSGWPVREGSPLTWDLHWCCACAGNGQVTSPPPAPPFTDTHYGSYGAFTMLKWSLWMTLLTASSNLFQFLFHKMKNGSVFSTYGEIVLSWLVGFPCWPSDKVLRNTLILM